MGNGEVLPGFVTLRVIMLHDALDGVQHRARPMKFARQGAETRGRAFDRDARGIVRVQIQAKPQPAIESQGDGARLVHDGGKRLQARGEQVQGLLAGAGAGADGQRVSRVRLGRLDVLGEIGDAAFQAPDGLRQLAQAAPGLELLIRMVSCAGG